MIVLPSPASSPLRLFEHAITDFALNRKAIRVAPVGFGREVWVWMWIHVFIPVSFIRLYEFAYTRRFAQVVSGVFGTVPAYFQAHRG